MIITWLDLRFEGIELYDSPKQKILLFVQRHQKTLQHTSFPKYVMGIVS